MITTTLTNANTVRKMTMVTIQSAAKDNGRGDSLSGARLLVATVPEAQIAAAIRGHHLHSDQALGTVPSQLQHVAVAAPIALDGVAAPRQP